MNEPIKRIRQLLSVFAILSVMIFCFTPELGLIGPECRTGDTGVSRSYEASMLRSVDGELLPIATRVALAWGRLRALRIVVAVAAVAALLAVEVKVERAPTALATHASVSFSCLVASVCFLYALMAPMIVHIE